MCRKRERAGERSHHNQYLIVNYLLCSLDGDDPLVRPGVGLSQRNFSLYEGKYSDKEVAI